MFFTYKLARIGPGLQWQPNTPLMWPVLGITSKNWYTEPSGQINHHLLKPIVNKSIQSMKSTYLLVKDITTQVTDTDTYICSTIFRPSKFQNL